MTADIEQRQQLNTAVSALMELVNELYAFSEQTVTGRSEPSRRRSVEHAGEVLSGQAPLPWSAKRSSALVVMLSPFAPHTAEELWEMLGHEGGLSASSWPEFDAEVAKADEIVVPVQVNGKVRGRLTVPAETIGVRARSACAGRSGGAGTYCRERRCRRWSS